MRYHVRCSKCEARFVFGVHPEELTRKRKCWSCGGTRYRVDKWMMERNTRATACFCSGYRWKPNAPHRKGSKACWYRQDGTQRNPGDADFYDPEWSYYNEQAA